VKAAVGHPSQEGSADLSGGLEVSEARRLKSLEDENRRLKKLLAEAMLDNAALKDLLGKNV
jgi:putative transposase